ncbi:MAG TPA: hypothetical protein VFU89_05105 [Rhabdochlamydiaceae bacterium]|nr:hypothetical protein [Rhabdochlamydiaceae bacterium]
MATALTPQPLAVATDAKTPTINTTENSTPSTPTPGLGIGSGSSSLSTSSDVSISHLTFTTSPISSSAGPKPTEPKLSSSFTGSGSTSGSSKASSSTSKTVKEDPSPDPNSRDLTIAMRIRRAFQRFLVRCPHTFIAMGLVYYPIYYVLSQESLAYSATTFVGVGGTVYCLIRAIFLELIPNWLLPRTNETRKWRHLMNVSYTAFITVMFTSAVWKLPELSAVQGLFFFTLSFGVPYPWLAKLYPDDIDKQPSVLKQKYDLA